MKRMERFCRLGILCAMLLPTGAMAGPYEAWSKVMPIRFQTPVNETLTNFPLLVRLDPASIPGFSYGDFGYPASGADLRFATSDETTPLNFEIEKWDTNGVSIVWVQVPALAGTNDAILAYWGKGDVSAPASATNGSTWTSGFKGVWHLSETNGVQADSTVTRNGAVKSGSPQLGVAGLIGGANECTSGYVATTNNLGITGNSARTISLWFNQNADARKCIAGFGTTGNLQMFDILLLGGVMAHFYAGNTPGFSYTVGAWQHATVTYNGSTIRIYINGILRHESAWSLNTGNAPLFIGSGKYDSSLNGRVDEVQLSTVVRSSNWIWATWASQVSNSTFATLGPVIEGGRPSIQNAGVSGITADAARLAGSLTSTGKAAAVVGVAYGPADGGADPAAWAAFLEIGPVTNDTFPAAFSADVTVSAGNNYFYRFWGSNEYGLSWAPVPGEWLAGEVAIASADPSAPEGGAPAIITLSRPVDGAEVPMAVAYTLGGAAVNGADYATLSGSVTFPAGSSTVSVAVSALNDYLFEGTESATLALAPGPYIIGSASNASLDILDAQQIRYVSPAGSHTAPFSSWADAATNIQAAIASATRGDAVLVAGGTYPVGVEVVVTNRDLTIRGGYEGAGAPGAADPAAWPSVITPLNGATCRLVRVTTASGGSLENFTFLGANMSNQNANGAAVYLGNCTNYTVANCTVVSNFSGASGGGVCSIGGANLLVTGCHFASNTVQIAASLRDATIAGGGLHLSGGSGSISNCVFIGNEVRNLVHAWGTAKMHGAGLSIYGGTWSVTRCAAIRNRIYNRPDNHANQYSSGVGIRIDSGTVTLRNCLAASNTMVWAYEYGGGIAAENGTVTISRCTVADNGRYGLYRGAGCAMTVSDSILSGHTVSDVTKETELRYCTVADGTGAGYQGTTTNAPLFVDRFYYHPLSVYGSYDGGFFGGGAWIVGGANSPTIDAGDPAQAAAPEPYPNGVRLNRGAYAGTEVAAMSPGLAVDTLAATAVTPTTARLNARVHAAGSPDVQLRFLYGTTDQGTDREAWDAWADAAPVQGPGDVSVAVSGLADGVLHYATVLAVNAGGEEAWGDVVTFTPGLSVPVIANTGALTPAAASVTLRGSIDSTGGDAPEVWIAWGAADGGAASTAGWENVVSLGVQTGAFQAVVTPGPGAFFYTAFAANTAGASAATPSLPFGSVRVRYVAADATGAGTGCSWADAFTGLQAALDAVDPAQANVICVKGGSYPLTYREYTLTNSNVSVRGGYEGVGFPGAQDAQAWPSVLTRPAPVVARIMRVEGVTNAELRSLVFQGGYREGVGTLCNGGGLLIANSPGVLIDSCSIVSNQAYLTVPNGGDAYGGGICSVNSTVRMLNSSVTSNKVTTVSTTNIQNADGGGLSVNSGAFTVSNCYVAGNFLSSDYLHGYVRGGGVASWGTLMMADTVVRENDAGEPSRDDRQLGDGVAIGGGTATLRNCLIVRNAGTGPQTVGVAFVGGSATLENCTIASNGTFGVFRQSAGTAVLRNSILWDHADELYQDVAGSIATHYCANQDGDNAGANGNSATAPAFVDGQYFHLQSPYGQYEGGYFSGGTWGTGSVLSGLIDAGDPAAGYGREPSPNGARLNIGCYGNSPAASKSVPLTVTNRPATQVAPTSATLNGEVLALGDPQAHAWFYYGDNDGGTDPAGWDALVDAGALAQTGTFSAAVSGLTPGLVHYYRAFATNSSGMAAWAPAAATFLPQVTPPEIVNVGVSNAAGPVVTIVGRVLSTGGDTPAVTIYYGTSEGAIGSPASWAASAPCGFQEGTFSITFESTPGENYFFTFYASNSVGDDWAEPAMPFGAQHIRYVDRTATGRGTGYSWTDAFTTLQAGLNACENGVTNVVHVRGGVYPLVESLAVTGRGIAVVGGYEGAGTPGACDSARWPTILTNNKAAIRLVTLAGADTVRLENLTLTGGNLTGDGGAALVDGCTNVTFRRIRAENNLATGYGGALAVKVSSNVVLDACSLVRNTAQTVSGHCYGGGLYAINSFGLVTNSAIERNTAFRSGDWAMGGGVHLNGGAWTFRDASLSYNTCTPSYGRGAGLYVASGAHEVRNSFVAGNDGVNDGDGLYVNSGSLAVRSATIAANMGQGVNRYGGTLAIQDSILWQNDDDIAGTVTLATSCVQDGDGAGTNGNIAAHPRFERGFYLAEGSPCRDAGSGTAAEAGIGGYTTRAEGGADDGALDMGWHGAGPIAVDDLYVAGDGDDANTGTDPEAPLRSITRALATAVEGSRIHVGAGVYDKSVETFPLEIARAGLQVLGAGAGQAIVSATGAQSRVATVAHALLGRVEGLTVCGGVQDTSYSYGGGLLLYNTDEFTLDGCTVSNNQVGFGGGGIAAMYGSDVTMSGLRVEGNLMDLYNRDQPAAGGGIHLTTGNGVLSNSVIVANRVTNTRHGSSNSRTCGAGLGFWGGAWTIERCVVVSNVVADPLPNYFSMNGGGILMHGGAFTLRNCLVARNRIEDSNQPKLGDGIGIGMPNLANAGGSLVIASCTIADNGLAGTATEGIRIYDGTAAVALTNGIVWGHTNELAGFATNALGQYVAVWHSDLRQGLCAAGGLNEDPLFDADGFFHLRSRGGRYAGGYFTGGAWVRDLVTSPCVDAGDPLAAYDRETRPNGKRINLGAYGNTEVASRTYMPGGTIISIY